MDPDWLVSQGKLVKPGMQDTVDTIDAESMKCRFLTRPVSILAVLGSKEYWCIGPPQNGK